MLIIKDLKSEKMVLLFIFIAGVFGYLGYKLMYNKPKYHLERTTTGHTVKFMDYIESKRHERLKLYGKLIIFLSILILGIGVFIQFLILK